MCREPKEFQRVRDSMPPDRNFKLRPEGIRSRGGGGRLPRQRPLPQKSLRVGKLKEGRSGQDSPGRVFMVRLERGRQG